MTNLNTRKLAPIILFVYNRYYHTKQTIEALQNNLLAEQTDLIIYSDGPKSQDDKIDVNKVRKNLQTIDGFKSIKIVKRENNLGLAASIINGVREVINEYGEVIVLEDDVVTNPYFLKFMNEALTFYKEKKSVWHISGWNYPINPEGLPTTFLWRVMNCWGWATWSDRWCHFERHPERLFQKFSKSDIYRFNLDGVHNFWRQVKDNATGKQKTWAIFWYATIFENRGLCLNPTLSLVRNIGRDGSGTNCGKEKNNYEMISFVPQIGFQDIIYENSAAVKKIKRHLKQNILTRIQELLCRLI